MSSANLSLLEFRIKLKRLLCPELTAECQTDSMGNKETDQPTTTSSADSLTLPGNYCTLTLNQCVFVANKLGHACVRTDMDADHRQKLSHSVCESVGLSVCMIVGVCVGLVEQSMRLLFAHKQGGGIRKFCICCLSLVIPYRACCTVCSRVCRWS